MAERHIYKTNGTCAKEIHFEIEENIIKDVTFIRGCPGSLAGISQLAKGLHIDDVIDKFKSLPCGPRSTSCPDQLSIALEDYKEKQAV